VEGSPLDRNVFLGLVVAGFVVLWGRQSTVLRFLRANPAILWFALYCGVSTIWSDYPGVALKRWIKSVGDLVMVLIVLTDRDRSLAIKRLLARVGFVLIPVSVLLVKYYPDMARYYSRWEGKMFISGVGEDKNMLGMTCLIFGLGAWWRLLATWSGPKDKNRTHRLVAHGTILAMTAWLLWRANSMTSISCFLMTAFLLAMTSLFRYARRPAMVHLQVLAIVCSAFSALFLKVGGGVLETMGRNSTLTGRTEIWKQLLNFAGNPFLGTGFQSFWVGDQLQKIWASGGYLAGINESHNAYLEVFLNLGWIGLVLLAVLLIACYRNVLSTLRQGTESATLGLAFFVVAVVYGFTEAAGFQMMNPVWFGFLLAATAVPPTIARHSPLRVAEAAAFSETEAFQLATGSREMI
jgi:O-antigen ligase